jgi:VanZ family protein
LGHNIFKILAVFWTLLIIYLCLDDAPNVPKFTFQNKDKVVHFAFYFVFVFLWIKSLKNKSYTHFLVVLFFALLLGITIEIIQENFTLKRIFDWYDILANSIGAFTSFIFFKNIYAIKN